MPIDEQDLTVQREGLAARCLGVGAPQIGAAINEAPTGCGAEGARLVSPRPGKWALNPAVVRSSRAIPVLTWTSMPCSVNASATTGPAKTDGRRGRVAIRRAPLPVRRVGGPTHTNQ